MERLSREFEKAEIDEDKVIRKLQRMEQSVFKDIEKDIFALFGRYATENNLTYEEAIRLLTSDEYRDFKMDVGSYIKTINNESVDEKAREKLELEYNTLAMKTRISRLEELTYRVNKNLDTLFFVTHRAVKELLEKSVTKSYNSAHTLKRDPSLRDKKLYKILEQPWSGANYSANIWNNRDKLAGIAQNEITKGIYQGKSAKKISKNISERLDASMKDIERVVRTESKHARNEASAQAYIDMGYEWYMFSSHTEGKSSERTCERCRKINEEKYRFDKRVVGENFPPLHPNCRCTIIPIMNDEIIENSRKEEYTEIVNNFENEKEYMSMEVDETDKKKVPSNKGSIIAQRLVDAPMPAYKSVEVQSLKPKEAHFTIQCLNEAAEKVGISKNEIPPICFCNSDDFKSGLGALASYQSNLNVIKFNVDRKYTNGKKEKLKGKTREEKRENRRAYKDYEKDRKNNAELRKNELIKTLVHELIHYLDAKEFRKRKNLGDTIPEELISEYNKWCRGKAKDFIIKHNINPDTISEYAKNSFLRKKYEEVYAEYMRKKIMEESDR